VLLVVACLAMALVGVYAGGELKVSRSQAMENVSWLRNTIAKLEADPEFSQDPAKRAELLSQLTQVAFNFGLNMPLNASASNDPICFRDMQVKTGTKPDLCSNDSYPSIDPNGRCYPACRANFQGHQQICREKCRAGFEYYALLDQCVETLVVGPNTTACPWYDPCGFGSARGCAKCPLDHPVHDMLLCQCDLNHTQVRYKPTTYDRGYGVLAACKAPRWLHNGLCYFNCSSDYETMGGLCIEKCPVKFQEIGVICCQTLAVCVEKVGQLAVDALNIVSAALAIATLNIGAIIDVIKLAIITAMDCIIPNCKEQ